jgi:hypothetical protein
MRPGVTGLWRLRGRELPVEERVALDLFYIRNYTVTLDVQILVATVRELARRLLGRADGLARWYEPEAATVPAPATASASAPAPDGSIPVVEPSVREESTRSTWSRP